jgi:type IV secretory pathway VirB10-like protein
MRVSTAFFAGVGTVVVAVAAGLGGGLTIANIMSPLPPRHDTTRLEQRVSAQPLPAQNQPDQVKQQPQAPVPYLAASPPAAAQPASSQAQNEANAPAAQTATQAPRALPREQAAASDDAAARARDADARRQADRRKSDRQQQWADRRKYEQQREQELRDAQARMQDDDESRDVVIRRDWRDDRRGWREDRDERDDYAPTMRFGFPKIIPFGSDD